MDNIQLIESLQKELLLSLPQKISFDQLRAFLSGHINHLITNNFHQLVALLYRIDVSETGLKNLLKESSGEDAGNIIADLIIERQLQKIKTRQQFSSRDENISENEKW